MGTAARRKTLGFPATTSQASLSALSLVDRAGVVKVSTQHDLALLEDLRYAVSLVAHMAN